MITQWINYLLDLPGDIITFLNEDCILWGDISLLEVIVVSLVSFIIIGSFASLARR